MAGEKADWSEYQFFVLEELKRLSASNKAILDKLNSIETQSAVQENKLANMSGRVAGMVSFIVSAIVTAIGATLSFVIGGR